MISRHLPRLSTGIQPGLNHYGQELRSRFSNSPRPCVAHFSPGLHVQFDRGASGFCPRVTCSRIAPQDSAAMIVRGFEIAQGKIKGLSPGPNIGGTFPPPYSWGKSQLAKIQSYQFVLSTTTSYRTVEHSRILRPKFPGQNFRKKSSQILPFPKQEDLIGPPGRVARGPCGFG